MLDQTRGRRQGVKTGALTQESELYSGPLIPSPQSSLKLDGAFPGEMEHFSGTQNSAGTTYLILSHFQDMVPCAARRDPVRRKTC